MRWGRVVGVALIGVVLAGGVVGYVYRDPIRVALAVRRCNAAWDNLRDYQSDFRVSVEFGPLRPSVKGRVAHLRPDAYRVDLGGETQPTCRVYASEQSTSVYFPEAKVAVRVRMREAEPAAVVGSQSPQPWLDQLAEATDVRWIGRDTVDGRPCGVFEFFPSSDGTDAGAAVATPALGRPLQDLPLLGDWTRTRVYLDDETGLPIRGEALDEDGGVLIRWTASNPQIDRGLSPRDFRFTPPKGVRIVEREYDPEHPERLFLPPDRGRSLLRRLGDALEAEAKEQLEGEPGKSLGEHVLDEFAR